MRRKYQVFISSSFIDLEAERKELFMTTLSDGNIPFGMELLKPGYQRGLDTIKRKIEESDIFVILVGARLGSPAQDLLAFTQKEYEYAQEAGLPIITFLLNETEYRNIRDGIKSPDPEFGKHTELSNFREDVKKVDGGSRIVGYFSYGKLEKLSRDYSYAITDCVDALEGELPHGKGWVKGNEYNNCLYEFDKLRNRIILEESVSKNPFFKDLAGKINKFSKLTKRTTIFSELKRAAAVYFWKLYFPQLYHKGIKAIFFESGSSIAYVSQEFINQIRQQRFFYTNKLDEQIRIRTNNVLTYLDFFFQETPWEALDVSLYPQGPFSEDYGGTYGKLNDIVPEPPPRKGDPPRKQLPPESREGVDNVKSDLLKDFETGGLVLMAASGVDTREESSYPGPHVGSYPNMLLKRSLLELPCPKVLFLHPDKWGFDFDYNNCQAVCDQEMSWKQVISSSPLAIAISTDKREVQERLSGELAQKGFTDLYTEVPPAGGEGFWSIIAGNAAFADFFRSKGVADA